MNGTKQSRGMSSTAQTVIVGTACLVVGLVVGNVIPRFGGDLRLASVPEGIVAQQGSVPSADEGRTVTVSGYVVDVTGEDTFTLAIPGEKSSAGAPATVVRVRLSADGKVFAMLPKTTAEIEEETGQSRSVNPGDPTPLLQEIEDPYKKVPLTVTDLRTDDIVDIEGARLSGSDEFIADEIRWIAALAKAKRDGTAEVYVQGRFPDLEAAPSVSGSGTAGFPSDIEAPAEVR